MERIPEISDERIGEILGKVKPVVRFAEITTKNGKRFVPSCENSPYSSVRIDSTYGESSLERPEKILFFVEIEKPRAKNFIFDSRRLSIASGLKTEPYNTILTFHDYERHLAFEPSLAEVLAQIPEQDIISGRCVAFEVVQHGFTDDFRYQIGKTKLYEWSGV